MKARKRYSFSMVSCCIAINVLKSSWRYAIYFSKSLSFFLTWRANYAHDIQGRSVHPDFTYLNFHSASTALYYLLLKANLSLMNAYTIYLYVYPGSKFTSSTKLMMNQILIKKCSTFKLSRAFWREKTIKKRKQKQNKKKKPQH